MEIEDVLEKYGRHGRTGRIIFKNHAFILIAKMLGGDWNKLTHNEKIFLKGEMIEHYAGTSKINEERWQKLFIKTDLTDERT